MGMLRDDPIHHAWRWLAINIATVGGCQVFSGPLTVAMEQNITVQDFCWHMS